MAFIFACYGGVRNGVAQETVDKGAKSSYGYKDKSDLYEDRVIMKEGWGIMEKKRMKKVVLAMALVVSGLGVLVLNSGAVDEVSNQGAKVHGWQKDGDHWYYFNEQGEMQTGWLELDGNWYYLRYNGQMLRGWELICGEYYLFKENGVMAHDEWVTYQDKRYFLTDSGKLQVNSISDILTEEQLKEYQVKDGIGTKIYRGIKTMDSFGYEADGTTLVGYFINLTPTMLHRLDPVIDEKGDGAVYDQQMKNTLTANEEIEESFTIITEYHDQARILRKYYIATDGNSRGAEIRYIDVETGEFLTGEQGEVIFAENQAEL